ncbi:MAG: hypothetical protein IH586_19975 [Anaerolineaceae bacterium]|nr:hypothetical protein [Anaerolineaceae bacterium]
MLFFLIVLALTACLPAEASPAPVPPTETATATPLPSATIIWFPATPTYTPFPTREITPTQDLRPEIGGLILEDRFDDPQSWATSRTAVGSVAFGQKELTLAVASPRGSLISLRAEPQLSDFYLEIDSLPSLCRTDDNYGLILRATSRFDYYRLLVNCNGQLRMERLKNEKPVLLQDWITSGQIFPGGMIRLRLGVWAQKDEMRVFVNDIYQFTVQDPVWPAGQVGVFARSAGDTPLTVNFSQLKIFSLNGSALVPSTGTATPPNPTR